MPENQDEVLAQLSGCDEAGADGGGSSSFTLAGG
jgi:hypothetical protein